jgi:hypothetical protein
MSGAKRSTTKFLNVDLDLRVDRGLDELLKLLEPFAFVLNKNGPEASAELRHSPYSLDGTLKKFVEHIEGLPPEAMRLWNQCEYRRFNVGIQAGTEPHESHFTISNKIIGRLANVGSELIVTVYAPTDD